MFPVLVNAPDWRAVWQRCGGRRRARGGRAPPFFALATSPPAASGPEPGGAACRIVPEPRVADSSLDFVLDLARKATAYRARKTHKWPSEAPGAGASAARGLRAARRVRRRSRANNCGGWAYLPQPPAALRAPPRPRPPLFHAPAVKIPAPGPVLLAATASAAVMRGHGHRFSRRWRRPRRGLRCRRREEQVPAEFGKPALGG
ncbi:Protein of unknown function [Gryllus bimaculatus]|nr:Protein of unknown function [Gryllus bimaculatus]